MAVRVISCFLCGIVAGLLLWLYGKRNRTPFFRFDSFDDPVSHDTDPNLLLRLLKNIGRFKMSMHIKVSQLDGAMRLAYMAKHLREKMIFYILCGSCGQQFFQSVIRIQQADEIYEVNSWIKKNFRNSFTVEELAEQKNMSVSQFIRDYRKMFGQSPKEDISKLRCQLQEQVIFLEKQARK